MFVYFFCFSEFIFVVGISEFFFFEKGYIELRREIRERIFGESSIKLFINYLS